MRGSCFCHRPQGGKLARAGFLKGPTLGAARLHKRIGGAVVAAAPCASMELFFDEDILIGAESSVASMVMALLARRREAARGGLKEGASRSPAKQSSSLLTGSRGAASKVRVQPWPGPSPRDRLPLPPAERQLAPVLFQAVRLRRGGKKKSASHGVLPRMRKVPPHADTQLATHGVQKKAAPRCFICLQEVSGAMGCVIHRCFASLQRSWKNTEAHVERMTASWIPACESTLLGHSAQAVWTRRRRPADCPGLITREDDRRKGERLTGEMAGHARRARTDRSRRWCKNRSPTTLRPFLSMTAPLFAFPHIGARSPPYVCA